MDFEEYAATNGVARDGAWVDIIDAAIDYLEEHVRSMPDDEDKTDDWYVWAKGESFRLATQFDEGGSEA